MESSTTSLTANITDGIGSQIQTDFSCFPKISDMMFTFIPVYFMITSVLGIVLNVFVLMVFCLHKKSCSTAEIYLSNMAAADLVMVSCLPFWAFYVLKHFNWTFGLSLCKLVNVSIQMNISCSIYFVVLLCMDCFLTLLHPKSIEGIRRPKFAKLGCVMVWILGFLFSLPVLLYKELEPTKYNRTACVSNYPTISKELTCEVSNSVFRFIPVFMISFFTINIIKTLRNKKEKGVNAKKTDHEETTLVLDVLLVFTIFWFPCQLMKLLSLLSDVNILTGCFFLYNGVSYSQIFCYLVVHRSVLNPTVYITLGENFQKKVIKLFRLRNHKRKLTINNPSTTIRLSGSVQSDDDAL